MRDNSEEDVGGGEKGVGVGFEVTPGDGEGVAGASCGVVAGVSSRVGEVGARGSCDSDGGGGTGDGLVQAPNKTRLITRIGNSFVII